MIRLGSGLLHHPVRMIALTGAGSSPLGDELPWANGEDFRTRAHQEAPMPETPRRDVLPIRGAPSSRNGKAIAAE
jgi:hypothetical protein